MSKQVTEGYGDLELLTDLELERKRAERPINLLSALLISVGLGGMILILAVLL